mmetsp:Transcript_18909/g.48355  ORF Transcript_18909/g.48355 Transcript_18909/m.48355 type:complete len:206 (+) Transcript_18909:1015-1632(+)
MYEPFGLAAQPDHHAPDLVEPAVVLIAVRQHPVPSWLAREPARRLAERVRAAGGARELIRIEVAVVLAEHVVDHVRRVEHRLAAGGVATKEHIVDGVDAEHARVVLVAHLVLPRAEAPARPDAEVAQRDVRGVHVHVPLDVRHGVAVLEAFHPARGDGGVARQHAAAVEAGDHLPLEVLCIARPRVAQPRPDVLAEFGFGDLDEQ